MFASKWGRKTFVRSMFIAWLGLLLPWFSFSPEMEGYVWGFYYSPYVALQAAIVLALCYNEPEKKPCELFFPVLVEILLILLPLIYIWQMMSWHTLFVTGKISFSIGLQTAYPQFWVAFALTFMPIFSFPILRRRKMEGSK